MFKFTYAVVASGLTSQIAPNDGLKRDDLCLLHEHGASVELFFERSYLLGHLINVGRYKMVRDDMCEFREPEKRYLGEEPALVWDTL